MGIFSQDLNSNNQTYVQPRIARDYLGTLVGMAVWLCCAVIFILILINISSSFKSNTWIEFHQQSHISDQFFEYKINNLIAGGIWLFGGAFPIILLVLFLYSFRRAYQYWRHQYEYASREYLFQTIIGLLILILSASAFATWQNLPLANLVSYSLTGGVIGLEINSLLIFIFGKTISFIIEFLLIIFSIFLIFRISILKISEYLGTAMHVIGDFYILKKSEFADRSLGELAKKMREETLTIIKKNQPDHQLKIIRQAHQTNILTAIPTEATNIESAQISNRNNTINSPFKHSSTQFTKNFSSGKSKTWTNANANNTSIQELSNTYTKKASQNKTDTSKQINQTNFAKSAVKIISPLKETSAKMPDEPKPKLDQVARNRENKNEIKFSNYETDKTIVINRKDNSNQSNKQVDKRTNAIDDLFANADNSDFEQTRVISENEQQILLDNTNNKNKGRNDYENSTFENKFENSQSETPNNQEFDHTIKNEIIEESQLIDNIKKSTEVIAENTTSINYEQFDNFPLPNIDLLDLNPSAYEPPNNEVIELTSKQIESTLRSFGVSVRVVEAHPGPVITSYHIELAQGIKGMQIINLAKDLARSLAVDSIRVVESIPGKTYMGLEIPNKNRQMVKLAEILASDEYNNIQSALTLAIGKDISGIPITLNLRKMPHLLVAGTTGSGKSVGVNAMILSMIYKATPNEIRLVMIDPKMVELSIYDDIPHLLAPVITDMKQAIGALNWCVQEMERRQELLASIKVRNLNDFNKNVNIARKSGKPLKDKIAQKEMGEDASEHTPYLSPMPYLVVIVDEYADLFMVIGKKIEELIARLAQKGRACGIHLILATQRPSVDVVTGLIKANIPSRIAYQVSSKIDSRTIIDQMGAESLLGHGDMLYYHSGKITRMHGAFVSDNEVNAVAEYLKSVSPPKYLFEIFEDPTENKDKSLASSENEDEYDQAVAIVIESRNASISFIQRRLSIGFNKAAKFIEKMEAEGIVSVAGKNGKREVLSTSH